MRTEKGMKQFTLHGLGKVKADAISAAVNFLQNEDIPVVPGKWCGHWDGLQWSSKKVYMYPENLKSYSETLRRDFNVEVVEN